MGKGTGKDIGSKKYIYIYILFTTDVLTCALTTGYLPFFYSTSPCAHCSYPEDDRCRSRNVGLLLLILLPIFYFLLHIFRA